MSYNIEIEIEGDKYRLEQNSCKCSSDCYPAKLYIKYGGYNVESYYGEVSNAARDFIDILIEKLKEYRGEEPKYEII